MKSRHIESRFAAAVASIAAVLALSTASAAHAQYDPGPLYDASGNLLGAGVTPWISDVDSSGNPIPIGGRQFAHFDTIFIAPRVLDYYGKPRAWPTNTAFTMFYQSGGGMTTSNLVWTNSNAVTFPVYHTVYTTGTTGVVYTAVTNVVTTWTTNRYLYSTNGVITNFVVVTYTTTNATVNSFTNFVSARIAQQCIDTGRVAVVFAAMQDFGLTPYTCWIAAYGPGGTMSQPVKFTINMVQSPGFGAAIATQPLNWQTWVSNAVYAAATGAWYSVGNPSNFWTGNQVSNAAALLQTNMNAAAVGNTNYTQAGDSAGSNNVAVTASGLTTLVVSASSASTNLTQAAAASLSNLVHASATSGSNYTDSTAACLYPRSNPSNWITVAQVPAQTTQVSVAYAVLSGTASNALAAPWAGVSGVPTNLIYAVPVAGGWQLRKGP